MFVLKLVFGIIKVRRIMKEDEFSAAIKLAIKNQLVRSYTDKEAEKLRQQAARVFERYESEMAERMSEQQKEHVYGNYLYS